MSLRVYAEVLAIVIVSSALSSCNKKVETPQTALPPASKSSFESPKQEPKRLMTESKNKTEPLDSKGQTPTDTTTLRQTPESREAARRAALQKYQQHFPKQLRQ